MCRLFGFRSVISSQVHKSLIEADNAIMHQSNFHSDGWGVAYYVASAPHIIKSTSTAVDDRLFRKVSGIVASETVIAHLRKATQGDLCITNAHPFQYGRWIFAHNGNIKDFAEKRDQMKGQISLKLRRYLLGSTDSEVIFFLLLSNLARRVDLHRPGCSLDDMACSVRDTLTTIREIVGDFHTDDNGPPDMTYLTFIITDGSTMLAHQGGKHLYYSTYKKKCSERDSCPWFSAECENPVENGYVNHLVFSSEPIQSENVWLPMKPGQMIGVNWNMKLGAYQPDATKIRL